jgi:hypothetical protein
MPCADCEQRQAKLLQLAHANGKWLAIGGVALIFLLLAVSWRTHPTHV